MRWVIAFSTAFLLSGCIVSGTMPVVPVPNGGDSLRVAGVSYAYGALADTVSYHNALWVHYALHWKDRGAVSLIEGEALWFNLGMGLYTENGKTYNGIAAGVGVYLMGTLPFDWFDIEYGLFSGGGVELSNYVANLFSGEVSDEGIIINPWVGVGLPAAIRIPLGNNSSVSFGAALFPPTITVYGMLNMEEFTLVVERKYWRLYTIGLYISN